MEEFYVVTIKRNGITLYINMMDGVPKWTKEITECCMWNDEEIALEWANKHFKECKDWEVTLIQVNLY